MLTLPLWMILLHLIPISMVLLILSTTIFLMILPRLPAHAVLMLTTAWLSLKLKSNAGADWQQKRNALVLR